MSTTTPSEIKAGAHTFQVSRLKVKDSLRGLRLVGKVLLPALIEASSAPNGEIGQAFAKVVEGLDCLPELLDLFAVVTKVQTTVGWATLVPSMVDDIFGGHPEWVVEFLTACVRQEYSGFLAGSGPLASLLRPMTAAAPTPPPAAS